MVDCPKHGHLRLVEKINVSKSKKYSKFGIINGYYCKDCNKYYPVFDSWVCKKGRKVPV